MKKILFSALMACFAMTASAQISEGAPSAKKYATGNRPMKGTFGLYVGAELGINFATAKAKNYDFKQQWLDYDAVNNVYSVKNQTTTVENNIKATSLKFEVEPALRLGWKF